MSDKDEIINLYRMENAAMVKKDLVTLNRILAPSMTLVHMTGYVQPKMEWIDQIQNGYFNYYFSEEEKIKDIRIKGNYAELTGQNQVKASLGGSKPHIWPLQMKMKFTKKNGQWIITNQVASTY